MRALHSQPSSGARRVPPARLDVPLIVAVALAIRLAFMTSAPPFLTPDSEGYYLLAHDLVAGLPFDHDLRRTPTYPLFIAAATAVVGEDLQRLVTVQHLVLGPTTAVLTYVLGRLLTGRLVALIAGLLTALSGPLLLYEHYVLTEALFAVLLLATLVTVLLAVRRASLGWAFLTGLLVGALILCRPVAQLLVPLLAGTLLLGRGPFRRRVAAVALLGLAAGVVVLPWMAYNWSRHGTFAVAGNGRFLLARVVRNDPGGFSFASPPGLVEDATRAAARRIVQEEAARRPPRSNAQRLREELGLSEAEVSRILADLAVEAIRERPLYFLQGSARFFLEILVGRPIVVPREDAEWREVDWERRARHVLERPVYPLDAGRARALLGVYDPARSGPLVPILFVVGLLMAALGLAPRGLLLPGLVALLLIAAAAALVGPPLRYRYPQDPLIALVAAEAVATAVGWMTARLRRPRLRAFGGRDSAAPTSPAG